MPDKRNSIIPPDQLYGELFHLIQMSGVFPDSKTFVDCEALESPEYILKQYERESKLDGFDLKVFVGNYFKAPHSSSTEFKSDHSRSAVEHINSLWPILTRASDQLKGNSSLIPLPYSYIVPGGRFGEIYYWDSYFTMLGLVISGQKEMAINMVKNFAYLIDHIGFIPNGNRSYFATRSQPPFFALMVDLIANSYDQSYLVEFLPQLRKEHQFWMKGKNTLSDLKRANERVVKVDKDKYLNRYWDDSNKPRQESYLEDIHLSKNNKIKDSNLCREIRAACESGWDFSSRWLKDTYSLEEVETTQIIPVDLNCLLFFLEKTLAKGYTECNNLTEKYRFESLAKDRLEAIQAVCWNNARETFEDFQIVENEHTGRMSLAMVFPLFFNIATTEQAKKIAHILKRDFLKVGGLVTTPYNTGQQWDAPNGWAPLQWMAVKGLSNYGFSEIAGDVAKRWLNLCEKVYKNTGKFVEKYNVEQSDLKAGGGEYPVQDGFGWSNGVYLQMLEFIKK